MRKRNYKGRCEKRVIEKCEGVCKTYDAIQAAYVDVLAKKTDIEKIQCNIPLEGEKFEAYMTDFLCQKTDCTYMVRECTTRAALYRPLTEKLLDMSRKYWFSHGITDWGIVVDAADK